MLYSLCALVFMCVCVCVCAGKELLPGSETNASFIDRTSKRVETLIHLGEQVSGCPPDESLAQLNNSLSVVIAVYHFERFHKSTCHCTIYVGNPHVCFI